MKERAASSVAHLLSVQAAVLAKNKTNTSQQWKARRRRMNSLHEGDADGGTGEFPLLDFWVVLLSSRLCCLCSFVSGKQTVGTVSLPFLLSSPFLSQLISILESKHDRFCKFRAEVCRSVPAIVKTCRPVPG